MTTSRANSVIFSLAAVVALFTAVLVAVRMSGAGWRDSFSVFARLFRHEEDHPHWELLMQ